jgi:hypothetical protein
MRDFMKNVLALVLAAGFSMAAISSAMGAGGCGEGFHRGPHGGCVRNWADPAAHVCPRGFHVGPHGHCVGN